MNRSSFALAVLLTALAGPLLLVGTAHSQTFASREVCTPPGSPVHPADLFGLLPYPGCADEYAAAEAACWGTPAPAAEPDTIVVGDEVVEDWRSFESFGPETSVPSRQVTDAYDDLFEGFREIAATTIAAVKPFIAEVDPSNYAAAAADAPSYQPYADNDASAVHPYGDANLAEALSGSESATEIEAVEVPVEAAVEAPASEYPSTEAYESEFSGYGTTDYLRDNFNYNPVKEFDLNEIVASRPLRSPELVRSWLNELLDSDFVNDSASLASEAYGMGAAVAARFSLSEMIDASELAWDRVEEHRRSQAVAASFGSGYRLPNDLCGWDCDYNWQDSVSQPPAPVAAAPKAEENRDTLLSIARSLRALANQLDSASEWLVRLGGHDVAELEVGSAAR